MAAIDYASGRLLPVSGAISGELRSRIELARLILISAIVFHHIRIPAELSLYTWHELGYVRGYVQIGLLKTATSTLTAISGYLCFMRPFEEQPMRFLRKKASTLLVPLIIWNIPFALMIFALQINGHYLDRYDYLGSGSVLNWANALFGLTHAPVNLPLHFLRNIIACNLIALAIAMPFRRAPVLVFLAIAVIGMYNLDGALVLRDDIMIGFFLGALIAVTRLDWKTVDPLLPLFLPLYLVSGYVLFLTQLDYDSPWWMLHRLLGLLTAWPLIGHLARTAIGQRLSRYSGYAFFIFLAHYYVGIGLFGAFSLLFGLNWFYAYFLVAGPLTIAICVAAQLAGNRLAPGFMRACTGGRSNG